MADHRVTARLKQALALALVDIRLLDPFGVGGGPPVWRAARIGFKSTGRRRAPT